MFGLSSNANVSVIQLLQCANGEAANGSFGGSSTNRSKAAISFSNIYNY